MSLERRIGQLERVMEAEGGPTKDEYEAAEEHSSWRSRLLISNIVEAAGVPVPPHCIPMIREARDNLVQDTEVIQAQDRATMAYSQAHGFLEGNRDYWGELHQKLLHLAERHPPGEPPGTMMVALALYGQEEADYGHR